jgi:uncharacterized paraquat-inducible protein A
MAAPLTSRILRKGTAAAAPVYCSCPKCSTRLRPERAGRFRCPWCHVALDLWMTAAAVRDRQPAAPPVVRLAAASEDQPPCAAHPQNASVVACSRCGDFICEVCRIRIEGKDLCPRCFEHGVDKAELVTVKRQFRAPELSLGLGILSLPGGCLLSYFAAFVGLVAVGVGIQALLKINRQPALKGKGKAVAGIVLGSIAFVLWVSLFLMLIFGVLDSRRPQ